MDDLEKRLDELRIKAVPKPEKSPKKPKKPKK